MDDLATTSIERAFWAYDRASVSNIAVFVALRGLSVEVLHQAARIEVPRHPYLRHGFSEDGQRLVTLEGDTLAWRPLDSPPAQGWVGVVEDELHTPFSSVAPRIRITVWAEGPSIHAVVTLPHVCCDAVSAYRWVGSWLRAADALLQGGRPESAPRAFVRPRSELFDPRRAQVPSWSGEVPGFRLTTSPLESYSHGAQAQRSRILPFRLTPEATERLESQAAEAGVSTNALWTAAALGVLAQMSPCPPDSGYRISTAVDVRSAATEPRLTPDDLGLWASRFDLYAQGQVDQGAVASLFQKACLHVVRRSAAHGLVHLSGSSGSGIPHLKVTNHGDLDTGFSDERGVVQRCQAFTALHRGMTPGRGFGLILQRSQGRQTATLVLPEPGSSSSPTPWASTLWSRLGLRQDEVSEG